MSTTEAGELPPGIAQPTDVPQAPTVPVPPDPPPPQPSDYQKAQYSQELSAWEARWKQVWADRATALALEMEREDTSLAVFRARRDTLVALRAARQDTADALENARDDAETAAEIASLAGIEAAYIATAQATLDRALTRTNVLTTSIGTIITLYTGLLGFIAYKAETQLGATTDDGVTVTTEASEFAGSALDVVALIPTTFLALALFLATVYAAVLRNKTTVGPFLPSGIGGMVAEMRLVTYMRWCFAGVLARRWALHSGVVSLGVGVATLPLPFLDVSGTFSLVVLIVGLALVLLTAAWTQFGPWLWNKIKS